MTFTVILILKHLWYLEWHLSAQASESIRRGLTPGPTPSSDLTFSNFSFPFWKMRILRPGWAGQGRAGQEACALESDSLTLLLSSDSLLSNFLNLAVPQFPYLSQQGLGEDLSAAGAAAEIKLVSKCQYMLTE